MFPYHAHLGSQLKKYLFSVPPYSSYFFHGSMIQTTIEDMIIYLSVQTTLPSILSPGVKTEQI